MYGFIPLGPDENCFRRTQQLTDTTMVVMTETPATAHKAIVKLLLRKASGTSLTSCNDCESVTQSIG